MLGFAVAAEVIEESTDLVSEDSIAPIERNSDDQKQELSVYPNPVSNELTITGLSGDDNYMIYNINGQVVIREQAHSRIDVSAFENGIYILRTMTGETLRFIKQ